MSIEHPILFSGPMVKAILEGRKTQTRRVMIEAYQTRRKDGAKLVPELLAQIGVGGACSYGKPGDKLWVRETWKPHFHKELFTCVKYLADGQCLKPANWNATDGFWCEQHEHETKWRPSIHMPRWASRITLEVTEVRVQLLSQIAKTDAIAEGIETNGVFYRDYSPEGTGLFTQTAVSSFCGLWDSINAKRNKGAYAWAKNPWVWVVEFRKI